MNITNRQRPAATLITCLRNEGPFLIEWLAYHKAIGFDRFIVGANDCTDGSHEMLVRLQQMGEILYFPFSRDPDGDGPQYQLADILHKASVIEDGDWIAWLDLDEFLVVQRKDYTIQTLLRALGRADGIRINWRIFGVPNDTPWPGRQIHPDLCRCAPQDFHLHGRSCHTTFKSLYKFRHSMRLHHHGPHFSQTNLIPHPDWRGGNGKALREKHFPWKRIKLQANKDSAITDFPSYGLAQVNHYMIRHPKLAKTKRERGRGSAYLPASKENPSYNDFANRYSDEYWNTYNQYTHHDPSILKKLAATDAQMARLLSDATLLHCHKYAQSLLPVMS